MFCEVSICSDGATMRGLEKQACEGGGTTGTDVELSSIH